VVAFAISYAGTAATLLVLREQDLTERRQDRTEQVELFVHEADRDCHTGNRTRQLVRDMGVDLAVDSALGGADALIAAADDPDPAEAEAYRASAVERARLNAEARVAKLAPLDCDEVARAARAEIESQLGGE
jgi:hypothetical protein